MLGSTIWVLMSLQELTPVGDGLQGDAVQGV
jgi:hypothetical protein